MEIKVGQVYRDPYAEDVIRISKIAGERIYFEILEKGINMWEDHHVKNSQENYFSTDIIHDCYTLDEVSTVKQILNKYL